MLELGSIALTAAWLFSVLGILIGACAATKSAKSWLNSAIRLTYCVTIFTTLALFALGWGFVNNEYTNQYIWQHSNRDMSFMYKLTAIWGGMDGSMLLWAAILTIATALAVLFANLSSKSFLAWTIAVLNSSMFFFLTICVFLTNPFRYLKADFIPPDGNGLNPLLQNPYMAIHPPMLYFGFTLFAIPFAFCLGALLAGKLNNEWIHVTRRWTLIAWSFLTAGIVLGGHWAYLELGWGGFWAWDPVENASFFPWLTATAFIHSVMVQDRKGMLKVWNVSLIAATYLLTVFGTFLTRSGVVQSVHAFASTDIGWVFLLYIAVMTAITILLLWWRRAALAPERSLENLFSRETAFLLNNLIFLSICFATLWGVMFPVFSEAITGQKQAVGIPFFNAINIPLFVLMIFLMSVGPLVAWSKNSLKALLKLFIWPATVAFLVGIVLLWAGITGFYPITTYCLVCFGAVALMLEMHRSMRVKKKVTADNTLDDSSTLAATSFWSSLNKHRIRFSGYLVHLGVFVAIIAITASMSLKTEKEFSLSLGEKYQVGRFELELEDLYGLEEKNYSGLSAQVKASLLSGGKFHAELHPELRNYPRNNETTTEVALKMSLRDDLYLVLAGLDSSGRRATFKVFINPLQVWLWIGTLVMIFGTILVIIFRSPVNNAELDNKNLLG